MMKPEDGNWHSIWTMSGVLFNMMGQGMALSYPSSLMPALQAEDAEIKADLATASWISSSVGVAAIPGFFVSSYLMDRFGRRTAQILVIIPGILGWVSIYFATGTTALLTGRIMCGFSGGASVCLGAIVIGEYTSPAHRGMFLNLKTAVVCVSGLIVHIFSHFYTWRTIALLSMVPYLLGLFIVLTWPESPAWLAYNGEFEKSERAFYWLRGKNDRSEKELHDMIQAQTERVKNTVEMSLKEKTSDFLRKFTRKDFLKPIFVICLGGVLLEAAGRHIFPAFALDIIGELTGNKTHSFALTLALDLIITVSATFSSVLISLMKRRLLLFSTGFAAVAIISVACVYLFLVSRGVIATYNPWVALPMFVIFFILVNLGCTPMPLAFLGELLPLPHRGVGSAICGIFLSLALYVGLQVTPFLLLHCKVYGTFAILGGCIAIMLLILYFVLPETKDRTLQEIEDYFNHGKFKEDVDKKDKEAMVKMITNTEVTEIKFQ